MIRDDRHRPHDETRSPTLTLTASDGRTVRVRLAGLAPRVTPTTTEQRAAAEPPRDDPRSLPFNPYTVGS